MIDGTFITELRMTLAEPKTLDVNGEEQLVLPSGWQAPKREIPRVAPLTVHTLTAFVEYVRANKDQLGLAEQCIAHVRDPLTVQLLDRLEGPDMHFRRQQYLVAIAMTPTSAIQYGEFVDHERFIIALQTTFLATKERDELIRFVASIKEHTVQESVDDGYAQSVNVQQGVTRVGTISVPNPVVLAPFRTFREIPQPPSPFVLRMRGGGEGSKPKMTLFEADGGQWKLDAIQSAVAYLQEQLGAAITVLG